MSQIEQNNNLVQILLLIGIFFLPFIIAISYLTLLIALILYLKEKIKNNQLKSIINNRLDVAVIIFYLITLFSSLVNYDQHYIHLEKIISSSLLGLAALSYYFITKDSIKQEKNMKKIIKVLLLQGLVLALYGIWEYLSGTSIRVSSFVGENLLPSYFNFTVPFLMIFFFVKSSTKEKVFLAGSITVMVICLILTYSRGGWLGFLANMITFLLLIRKRLIPWFLGLGSLSLLFSPFSIKTRILSIFSLTNTSNLQRFYIWESSIRMLKDHVLVGVGPNQYRFLYPQYLDPNAIYKTPCPHAHNIFLHTFTETGILGGITFLYLLYKSFQSVLCYIRDNTNTEFNRFFMIACFSGLLGVLVQGLFDYPFYNNGTFILMWTIIGLISSFVGREKEC